MSNFFVYIVESPSAPDLYHRRSEGQLLLEALRLNGIPSASRCVISIVAFEAALKVGLTEELENNKDRIPIIHFSCHGSSDGLHLSNGEFISWEALSTILEPINSAMSGKLVVAMSCCEGYSGVRMAMKLDESPHPYFCLIGTPDKPTWADTSVAFTAFYHRMNKGDHVNVAVQAMCHASGINTFFVEWAERSKQGYLEYRQKEIDSDAVSEELSAVANAQSPEKVAEQALLEKGGT